MGMGKAYSVDLRLRVLGAVDGGMSKMAAHKLFGVSRSTIDDWLQLRAETGAVLGKPRQERRPPRALAGSAFSEFAAMQQGATLGQMALAWQRQHGQKFSAMSLSRALASLGPRLGRAKKELALPRARRDPAPGVRAAISPGAASRPRLHR